MTTTCNATKQPALETHLYIVECAPHCYTMTLNTLHDAFNMGRLRRSTRVWTLGWYDWVPLDDLLGRADRMRAKKRASSRRAEPKRSALLARDPTAQTSRRPKPPLAPSRRGRAIVTSLRGLELRASPPAGRAQDPRSNKTNPTAPAWWLDATHPCPTARTNTTPSNASRRRAAVCVVAIMLSAGLYWWSSFAAAAGQ